MVAYLSLEPVAPKHLLTPLRNVCLVAFNIGSVVTIHFDILRRGSTQAFEMECRRHLPTQCLIDGEWRHAGRT